MIGPYEHIACCVEPSPAIDLVLGEVERLRELGEGRLSFVHVVEPPEAYADIPGIATEVQLAEHAVEEWLRAQCGRMRGAEPVVLEGAPAPAVCDWARAAGVDLILASAHRGLRERVELGSFAGHLTYNAPCSLHLVRPPLDDAPG